jgi:hypothetical protein
MRIDVARHYTKDQIAIRQHAYGLLQCVSFSMHDQKSDVQLAHPFCRFSRVCIGANRHHRLLAIFTYLHDTLSCLDPTLGFTPGEVSMLGVTGAMRRWP